MTLTREDLLTKLRNAINNEEWNSLSGGGELTINSSNRRILLEMKDIVINDGQEAVDEEKAKDLYTMLVEYLSQHLKDKPDGWKWIIISSLYLTFVVQRPMHPLDVVKFRITEENGKTIYECPLKTDETDITCYYCVCRKMSEA